MSLSLAIQDAIILYLSEVKVRKELGADSPTELVQHTYVEIRQHKGPIQDIGRNSPPYDYNFSREN